MYKLTLYMFEDSETIGFYFLGCFPFNYLFHVIGFHQSILEVEKLDHVTRYLFKCKLCNKTLYFCSYCSH